MNTENPANQAEASSTPTAPVRGTARIESIDTLRGFALLGILLLNIVAFGLPVASYFNPVVDGSTQGPGLTTFVVTDVLFEGGMRAIFSMLFGAGLLIFVGKPAADPVYLRGLYYRRTLLLIAFGLIDAWLFVWYGDILYAYGMAGLILYFFRNAPPRRLALYSGVLLVLLVLFHTGLHFDMRQARTAAATVEALPEGTVLTEEQDNALVRWQRYLEFQNATPELIEQDIRVRRSGYVENFLHLVPINVSNQTFGLLTLLLWDALAMMLLGMAFMKWGIFNGSRSKRFYLGLVAVGFGVGVPLNGWETLVFVNSGFAEYWTTMARPTYDIGRMSLALGYIGLVMLICKAGLLSWLRQALAAAGRMALTNYLAQTLLCNFLFMGFGLGLAGHLQRHELYYVVLAIWIFQLFFSIHWLKRYRFGPAEWLWRSLTYGKRQSLRR